MAFLVRLSKIEMLFHCIDDGNTNKQTSKPANQQTSKPANQQTSKQANKQTSKQANQQTNYKND